MTPTREQVIEWARASGAIEMRENALNTEHFPWGCEMEIDNLLSFAALAYTAGRLKGLDEAKEACATERAEFIEQSARNDGRHSDMAFGGVNSADRIAAAIDQLKEQK